ncbi:hypothetical protein D9615_004865 [Tricholomella constricta]|uniref:FHA domain-containing protein n=1 Tax=Tricholomella constricta TaxID=117010 RepID=A0A8H5M6P1_9AGAR|nr:hypothetical protein D9615_004865 [Tricholomella constricta]
MVLSYKRGPSLKPQIQFSLSRDPQRYIYPNLYSIPHPHRQRLHFMIMSVMGSPMLSLTAAVGSFPFQTKYIPMSRDVRIKLGAEVDADSGQTRSATQTNGWFAPQRSRVAEGSPVSPLPLSSSHSEFWWDGQQVYIRDLDSPFGTYVNDVKIKKAVVLSSGDIISLGSKISRNANTPSYITDDHLKPVIAKVTLAGVSSS